MRRRLINKGSLFNLARQIVKGMLFRCRFHRRGDGGGVVKSKSIEAVEKCEKDEKWKKVEEDSERIREEEGSMVWVWLWLKVKTTAALYSATWLWWWWWWNVILYFDHLLISFLIWSLCIIYFCFILPKILHGTLCAHNVFLADRKQCKLSDYGLSSSLFSGRGVSIIAFM